MPKIHYTRFPVTSPYMGKLPTCCQQVVVMEFGKRHDTTDTMDRANVSQTCCGLVVYVADLLRTCYRETGVMEIGLYSAQETYVYVNYKIVRFDWLVFLG